MRSTVGAFAAISIACACVAGTAQAEIFKCVGHDGKTSFQQTPCAPTQTESKVSAEQSSRWEVLSRDAEGNAAWVSYIDVARVRNEEFFKRIYFRRELEQDGKIIMSTTSEELFDCTKLRSKILAVNGERRNANGIDAWRELKDNAKTRALGEKIKAKVCSAG